MGLREEAIEFHKKARGKIEVRSRVPVANAKDLTLAYTPGVAEPCKDIAKNRELVYEYTRKWNNVAVVTDGTRVLGLGDIGPEAGLPVMEGKAVLFKVFGGVDAFPICVDTKEADEIVETVKRIAPVFGGINLEDIENPKCFEVEEKLANELEIPVFHDDQHGTAVVCLAGLINALRVVGKKKSHVKVVVNGAGAAGDAVAKLLVKDFFSEVVVCDSKCAIYKGRDGLEPYKQRLAALTNRKGERGSFSEVVEGADAVIGVSKPGTIKPEDVRRMNENAVVFALANPVPEILPEEAKRAGARVVATGRSDFANQINNVLGFPGIFRGMLDVRARRVNPEMKLAAAYALANIVRSGQLSQEYIVPKAFDRSIAPEVAAAVGEAAVKTGVARLKLSRDELRENAERMIRGSG